MGLEQPKQNSKDKKEVNIAQANVQMYVKEQNIKPEIKEVAVNKIKALGFTPEEAKEVIQSYQTAGFGEFRLLRIRGHEISFRRTPDTSVFIDSVVTDEAKGRALFKKYTPIAEIIEEMINASYSVPDEDF